MPKRYRFPFWNQETPNADADYSPSQSSCANHRRDGPRLAGRCFASALGNGLAKGAMGWRIRRGPCRVDTGFLRLVSGAVVVDHHGTTLRAGRETYDVGVDCDLGVRNRAGPLNPSSPLSYRRRLLSEPQFRSAYAFRASPGRISADEMGALAAGKWRTYLRGAFARAQSCSHRQGCL